MGIWAGEQAQRSKRHTASKYDFIKVKVWLGETQAHYYILSRFLISRMLTVTKIPYMKAVKIALEVKKYLVDGNHFDITQGNLEEILFHIMSNKGYGEEYVKRYKMVTAFHQQRRPLIILLCGAPCTGKSSMAQQLASRLNMPNVLQTDIICELLRMDPHHHGPLHGPSLWSDEAGLSGDALIAQFQRECHVVRKGLEGDLAKTVKDGKSIIIEGFHLDPGLYLYEFGKYGVGHLTGSSDFEGLAGSPTPLSKQVSSADLQQPAQASQARAPSSPPAQPADGGPAPCGADPAGAPQEQCPSERANAAEAALSAGAGLAGPRRKAAADDSLQPPGGRHLRATLQRPSARMLFALTSREDRHQPVLTSWEEAIAQAGFPVRKEAQPFVPQQEQQPALSHSPGSEWLRQAMAEQLSRQGSSKPAAAVEAAAGSSITAELAALAASDRKAEACSTADVATLTAMLEAHAVKDAQTQRKLDQIQSAPACATQPTSDVHSAAACAERQQTEPVDGLPQLLHSSLPLMQSSSGQLLALQQELEHVPATFQDRRPPAPSQAPSDQQPTDVRLSSANNSVPTGNQSTNKSIESPKDSNSPVFVPIVLAMEESDHRVLIQEWHARQLNGCSSPDYPESVYQRLHSLQDRLCRYAQRDVPVVHVSIASFPTVLDKLHDYLLKCIEVAMQGS